MAGVVETVPSFRSLLVYYDPGADRLRRAVRARSARWPSRRATAVLPPPRRVELPCCYDDRSSASTSRRRRERLGLAPDELVRLHAGAEYLVYFIGFTPGLPYMTGMPERIRLPRLETPRMKVPAGQRRASAASSAASTRSRAPAATGCSAARPLRLYDPEAAEPTLLRPGDRVRFRPIDRAEFDAIAARVAARDLPAGRSHDPHRSTPARRRRSRTSAAPASSATASRRRGRSTVRAFVHRQPPRRQRRRRRRARVHADRPALRGRGRRARSR